MCVDPGVVWPENRWNPHQNPVSERSEKAIILYSMQGQCRVYLDECAVNDPVSSYLYHLLKLLTSSLRSSVKCLGAYLSTHKACGGSSLLPSWISESGSSSSAFSSSVLYGTNYFINNGVIKKYDKICPAHIFIFAFIYQGYYLLKDSVISTDSSNSFLLRCKSQKYLCNK